MYNVVIVDDEPFILEGLRHIINWEEYDLKIIGEASYGLEALEIIDRNLVDILITDIRMPFMDGFELIKQIREKNLDIKFIILSGYDDFGYVKEAVKLGIENYILKPLSKEELISTLTAVIKKIESNLLKQSELKEGARVIRNNILLRWMTDEINREELLERMLLLDIRIEYGKYLVVIIKSEGYTTKEGTKDADDPSLHRDRIECVVNEVLEKFIPYIAFPDWDGDCVLVFFDATDLQKKILLNKFLPECRDRLVQQLNAKVFITVGSHENSIETVSQSYAHAKYLQDYRLVMISNRILSYEDITKPGLSAKKELKIDYEALCNCIILKKRKEALSIVEEFYNSRTFFPGLSPSIVYNITIEILFNIKSTIKNLRGNIDVFEEHEDLKDLYINVLKIKNINELKEWLRLVINTSIDCLSMEDDKSNMLFKKVLAYIQANYSRDINLKTISSEFNNNTAYLGQLFRKESGESFTNYLNKVRIEKAIELMTNTNYKMNEISKSVGYNNTNYFYTVFKKVTGTSPNEFIVK